MVEWNHNNCFKRPEAVAVEVNLPGLYHHADANWSKADVEIIKIYSSNGIVWAKCNPINRGSSLSAVLGNKIFINIEAAVDNKEIVGIDQQSNYVSTIKLNTGPTPTAPTHLKTEALPIPHKFQKASHK